MNTAFIVVSAVFALASVLSAIFLNDREKAFDMMTVAIWFFIVAALSACAHVPDRMARHQPSPEFKS